MTPPVARVAGITHRLVSTRYPPVGIFDSVASGDDLVALFELEGWTSDRLGAEVGKLEMLPQSEWVTGVQGATSIMAAFCYPSPEGGRFTGPDLGAWYCALDLETAIAETAHHNRRRLLKAGMLHAVIQMRQLVAEVDAAFHDIRGQQAIRPELYDPNDYAASQTFAADLRGGGSNGIAYDSVRRQGGHCLAVFRPRLVPAALQGDHWEYRWNGSPEPVVTRLTNKGTGG
ncbi:RES family NAD+ phosphorylase [Magnetospirillum fulvum]|uniref:RES family NAD+ phosphorylase n=1 Tax=Magnetospirillum fulvum TaxID=1082 RepID=UPI000586C250|nr:RES family NAD+ phosphorylase [Magnetospirillum fulvum]